MSRLTRGVGALVIVALGAAFGSAGASAQPLPVTSGFTAQLVPAEKNPALYRPYYDALQASGFLTRAATFANSLVRWPRPVLLLAGECGVANAFFRPDTKPYPSVVICYEFMEAIAEEFRYDGMTPEELHTAIYSTVMFLVLHEVGHAAVHELQLPVLGREEDAVDAFATLVVSGVEPSPAVWAAEYWMQKDDFGDTGLFKGLGLSRSADAFADEHGLDEQRFFNIVCWTYGANPQARASLLERRWFPQARADRCPREFAQMASSWSSLLAEHRPSDALALPAALPQPTAASIHGTWRFTEAFKDPTGTVLSCEDQGTITFARSGEGLSATMSQTGQCRILLLPVDNAGDHTLQGVMVDDSGIRMLGGGCEYVGQFVGARRDQVSGTVTCTVPVAGQEVRATGEWEAASVR